MTSTNETINTAVSSGMISFEKLQAIAATLQCWNSDDGAIHPRGAESGVSKPYGLSKCMQAREASGEIVLKPMPYNEREKFPDTTKLAVPLLCQTCSVSLPLRRGIVNLYKARTRT